MSEDLYKILGVDKSISQADLKKAYRKLAMKYHPDQNKGNAEAEQKFKDISHAYDILKDEQKRAAYDRYGASAFDGSMGGGGAGGMGGMGGMGGAGFGGAFSDIFEDMFGDFMGGQQGSGRGAGGSTRGADMQYTMSLSLEEAYTGTETTIKIPTNETCPECTGSGAEKGTSSQNCDTCAGQGRVRQQQGFFTIERTCPKCNGEGSVIETPCKKCSGSGRMHKEKTLKVKIPAGVEQGRRIRLSGEGEAGLRGGAKGDLYVLINIKAHKFFKRDGAHLFCRVPIPFTQAALGGSVEVPTIEGARGSVKIPAGTQTGQQFRLKGKGMSVLNSSQRGDAFIEIFVETPVNLNKEQEELLKKLDKSLGGTAAGNNKDSNTKDKKTAAKHSPESSSFMGKVKDFIDDLKD